RTAEALHGFSEHWISWAHWHELFRLAAQAAERTGDSVAHAMQLNHLSSAQVVRGDHQAAAETALRAAALAQQAGDERQQAWGYQNAARALTRLDSAAALPHAEAAERLFIGLRDDEGLAQTLKFMSVILIRLKRPREAVEKLEDVLELVRAPQSSP